MKQYFILILFNSIISNSLEQIDPLIKSTQLIKPHKKFYIIDLLKEKNSIKKKKVKNTFKYIILLKLPIITYHFLFQIFMEFIKQKENIQNCPIFFTLVDNFCKSYNLLHGIFYKKFDTIGELFLSWLVFTIINLPFLILFVKKVKVFNKQEKFLKNIIIIFFILHLSLFFIPLCFICGIFIRLSIVIFYSFILFISCN